MESYFTGGSEECNSCESGWTTYIASPMHDDDASADSGDAAAAEDDSDDSMASDASSGPSHHEQYYGAVHEMDSSENDDEGENEEDRDEGDVECSEYSHEKSYKRKEKSRGGMDLKKENPIHLARKTDPVCTSSKVRKTDSMTKAN